MLIDKFPNDIPNKLLYFLLVIYEIIIECDGKDMYCLVPLNNIVLLIGSKFNITKLHSCGARNTPSENELERDENPSLYGIASSLHGQGTQQEHSTKTGQRLLAPLVLYINKKPCFM